MSNEVTNEEVDAVIGPLEGQIRTMMGKDLGLEATAVLVAHAKTVCARLMKGADRSVLVQALMAEGMRRDEASSLVLIVDNALESHLNAPWNERLSPQEKNEIKQALLAELEASSKGQLSKSELMLRGLTCDELLKGTRPGSLINACVEAGMPREQATPLVNELLVDLVLAARRKNFRERIALAAASRTKPAPLPEPEKPRAVAGSAEGTRKPWWQFWKS